MAKILGNFHLALLIGIVLLVAAMFGLHREAIGMEGYWTQFLRYLHVFAGILWIGLLYYFNFVQIPTMPKVPAELKPGVTKYIAPAALFWFRWAALSTVVTGLILAIFNGYLFSALFLGIGSWGQPTYIGIGMWLGLIMAYNVWMIIWPNQQKVLGLVAAEDEEKKAAARTAMLASRFNTMLSIPMLYFMVAAQNLS